MGKGYLGRTLWAMSGPCVCVLELLSIRHVQIHSRFQLLTRLSHASWPLVRRRTPASSHWRTSRVSLLRWRLAVLLVVAMILGRRSSLRLLPRLLIHIDIVSLMALVPSSALVVVSIVPLFMLTVLFIAVIVILLVVLGVVHRLSPLLRCALIVVLLLSRWLLIVVVLLPLLLWVGHRYTRSRREKLLGGPEWCARAVPAQSARRFFGAGSRPE